MSEIEKLYKNAGVLKKRECSYPNGVCKRADFIPCELCAIKADMIYPPFTAEKQLELIIFIINKFGTLTFFDYEKFTREVMAEKIAKLLNNHWQNLGDILKQQIKEILE